MQIPSILRYRLFSFRIDWRHPGLAKAWSLLIPVAMGSGAAQINLAFDRYFASTLTAGSTAGLSYTTKLAFLPIQIVAGAIGTVTFPLIAAQFATSNNAGIRRSIGLSLRMVGFIVIPCAVGLSVLAFPIVQTLFERGAFGPSATALCASLIPFACIPLVAISYNTVLGRACYACKEVRLAVVGSISAVGINVALSSTLLPILGARGLLLANGIAGLANLMFLIALLWRLIGGFDWKTLVSSFLRITLAALIMAGILYAVRFVGFVPAATVSSRLWCLTVLLAIGATVFFGAAYFLGVEELRIAVTTIGQKFARKSGGTADTLAEPGV